MISFIVIGKNEGWRLEKCFKGIYSFIKEESIVDYEVIYVDSRSTDSSVELSKSFNNTKTILITGDCNAAIARNIGAKEASGDILFFIDGDMELIPGFYLDVVKDGKMVYPFVSGIEKDILHDNNWNYVETQVRRKYTEGIDQYEPTTGGLFMIEAQLWERVGGMDTRFRRSQDLDLGYRLTKMGYKLCRKPQIWVNHYTRFMQVRRESMGYVKYNTLLLRNYFFYPVAQRRFLVDFSSFWMLLFSFLLMIVMHSWYPILLYFAIICFRVFRTIFKHDIKYGFFMGLIWQIKFDFLVINSFLFFWPKTKNLQYEVK